MRLKTVGVIVILAFGILLGLLPTHAQQAGKVFRIAELNPIPPPPPSYEAHEAQQVFRRTLHELGFVEGTNLRMEDRFAAWSNDRLHEYAAELVRLKVDVIFAVSSLAVRAARDATQTIPIVAHDMETDPVARGLAASLARPGGNLTGFFLDLPELSGKQLELLAEAVPGIKRVAFLWDPAMDPVPLQTTEAAARSLGVVLRVLEVHSPNDYENALRAANRTDMQALMVQPSPWMAASHRQIAELAVQHQLPTMSIFPDFVEAGFLMSYGPNLTDEFRRSATYVARILNGAKPGDLPIQRPTQFNLVINLKTAKALGLTIPPRLLFQADKVIK
jgi:putative ABC transport system substrate-binding protein